MLHFLNPCLRIMAPKAHPNISLTPRLSVLAPCNMWTILAYSWLIFMWSKPIPGIGRLLVFLASLRLLTDH